MVGKENDQRTLYMRAVEIEDTAHHGVRFFNDLIKRNRGKLEELGQTGDDLAMTRALKNLYQKTLATYPFYINRVDGKGRITQLVNSGTMHPFLSRLMEDDSGGKINLACLTNNESFSDFIEQAIKSEKSGGLIGAMDLYISSTDAIVVKTAAELRQIAERVQFVREAMEQGDFYCLRWYVSVVERVEIRKIGDELEYIHRYAQHKSKSIAQLLTRILNVGEMVDVTGFVVDQLKAVQLD